ncbi:TPA: hypothetical protein I8Z67_002980 [Legionella pneumophila]|nr:hypothetical protein [Legionella pneumophila]
MTQKQIKPRVFISSGAALGKEEICIHLTQPMILSDVNLNLLKFAIKKWKKRNIKFGNTISDQSLKQPTLFFPLCLGGEYQDSVTLCRISNGLSLSAVERFAVKHAFKFTPATDEIIHINSSKSIEILIEHITIIIHQLNESLFNSAFSELIKLHSLLLKLGETTDDNGNPINYAIVEANWFGTQLHNEWARSYMPLFDASLAVLEKNDSFLRKCSYIAVYLAKEISKNQSITGLDSITNMQGCLWYKLNGWWERTNEQLERNHNIGKAVTSGVNLERLHKNALQKFIQGWEHLLKFELSTYIKEIPSWKSYKILFRSFNEHLSSTILFLGKSVLSGNQEAAYYWADFLTHWINYSQPTNENFDYIFLTSAQELLITPSLLDMPWDEVEGLIQSHLQNSTYPIQHHTIFSIILKNYWQDCCFILSNFLISWSTALESSKTLSIDIIKRLIEGTTIDDSDSFDKSLFFENQEQFIISFIRRHLNIGSYQGTLTRLIEKINQLSEPERFSGRIYSFANTAEEINYDTELILATLRTSNYRNDLDSLKKLLASHDLAYQLENITVQFIKYYEKNNVESYKTIFDAIITHEENNEISYDNRTDNISKIKNTHNKKTTFEDSLKKIGEVLYRLIELIKSERLAQIKNLPISSDKLINIEEKASYKAFNKKTANFPVALFNEIKLLDEPLIEFRLKYEHYPKGQLTVPPMDHTLFSEDYHHKEVSSRLYAYLIFDILNEAKKIQILNEVSVDSEDDYAEKLIQIGKDLINQKLNPIIIIDNNTHQFIYDWKRTLWDPKTQIPEGIKISKKENRFTKNYMFDLNDIPVYKSNANTKNSIIFPLEILNTLKFRQFKNGYPVEVTFDENPDNPWDGTLTYLWERTVELDKNYDIYTITLSEEK